MRQIYPQHSVRPGEFRTQFPARDRRFLRKLINEQILDRSNLDESCAAQASTFLISAPQCGPHCSHSSLSACAFKVDWSINAHMKVGAVNTREALAEHDSFRMALKLAGAYLYELPFVHGAYDSVFVKDNAILGRKNHRLLAYLAEPKCEQRKLEQTARKKALERHGFEVTANSGAPFEGGDVVVASNQIAYLGHGYRSNARACRDLSKFLEREVVPLELKDPYFYHLDTALAVLNDGSAYAYRGAFTDVSWKALCLSTGIQSLTEVSREEAMQFALNWVEVGNTIVIGSYVPEVIWNLRARGKRVHVSPLTQYQLAGGSAACLTAKIHPIGSWNNDEPPTRSSH